MPEVEGLKVRISADLGDYTAKMQQMENQTVRASDKVSGAINKMASTANASKGAVSGFFDALATTAKYSAAAGALYGVTSAFTGAVKAGMSFNSMIEQNTIAFQSLTKDAEVGSQMIRDLWKLAAETPYEMKDVTAGAKKLLAFGFNKDEVIDMLRVIGDTASAMGMSGAEGIGRITTAIGQMQAKSKVSGDEMLQLTEAGIPAWDILAKAMNKTTQEVMALSEKGLIPADQAIKALLEGMNSRFGGMMEKQSKTFAGQMSTLADITSATMGQVVKPIFDELAQNTIPAVTEQVSLLHDVLAAGGYDALAKSILPPEVINSTTAGLSLMAEGWELQGEAVYKTIVAVDKLATMLDQAFVQIPMAEAAILVDVFAQAINEASNAANTFRAEIDALVSPFDEVFKALEAAANGNDNFLSSAVAMASGAGNAFMEASSSAWAFAAEITNASNQAYADVMSMWDALAEARSVNKSDMDLGSRQAKTTKASKQRFSGGGGTTVTPGAGKGKKSGGKQQTEYEKYKADTKDMLDIWGDQVDLEKLSLEQFAKNVQERLTGLAAVNALEKELVDKQRLEYELTGKIQSLGKEQRQEAIEKAGQQLQLGQLTIEQYAEIVKKQASLATSEKERMSLAVQSWQAQDKVNQKAVQQIEYLSQYKQAALAISAENERHAFEMTSIFSDQSTETKLANLKKESDLAKKKLDDEYANESKSLEDQMQIYAKDAIKYTELVKQKELLDKKYQLNKTQQENDYIEKVATQQKAIIDANNDMISSLILKTKSGHDILNDMWSEFVKKVVAKMSSVKSSMNIFEQILGPLFGLNRNSISDIEMAEIDNVAANIKPISGARASGGPVEAGKAYLVGEKGPEPFIPSVPGTIIPNNQLSNFGGNQQISVNVVNNTGVEATPTVSKSFDMQKMILTVTLDAMRRDDNYQAAIAGAAARRR